MNTTQVNFIVWTLVALAALLAWGSGMPLRGGWRVTIAAAWLSIVAVAVLPIVRWAEGERGGVAAIVGMAGAAVLSLVWAWAFLRPARSRPAPGATQTIPSQTPAAPPAARRYVHTIPIPVLVRGGKFPRRRTRRPAPLHAEDSR